MDNWMFVGLVWLLSLGVTYLIAERRDAEDKWLWIVIGLFYGPVAILLALVKARPATS